MYVTVSDYHWTRLNNSLKLGWLYLTICSRLMLSHCFPDPSWCAVSSTATRCQTFPSTPSSSHTPSKWVWSAVYCVKRCHLRAIILPQVGQNQRVIISLCEGKHVTNSSRILQSKRFIDYAPTSLERNYKYELLTEHDLGVHVDLILPEAYEKPEEQVGT